LGDRGSKGSGMRGEVYPGEWIKTQNGDIPRKIIFTMAIGGCDFPVTTMLFKLVAAE
jgi:hypothetical protein